MSGSLIYTSAIAKGALCRSSITAKPYKSVKLHHVLTTSPSNNMTPINCSVTPVTSNWLKSLIGRPNGLGSHSVLLQSLVRGLSSSESGKPNAGTSGNVTEKSASSGPSIISELFESKRTEEEEQKLKEDAEKSRQNQMRATKFTLYFFGAMIGGGVVFAISEWGPPRKDEEGSDVVDEFTGHHPAIGYPLRAMDALYNYNEVLKEPIREKLLPDPLTYPYQQPKYTVVLELTGILFHPDWTYKTGWRFKKRPFLDFFLAQLAPPTFETVIFTSDSAFTAHPLIDSLDPNGYTMYRLYRDSTRYINGTRVKDCNVLNRDLSKVVHIEWDEKACSANQDNCLVIPKWDGSDSDKSLFDLAQFLRAIAIQDVDDVRDVIKHYKKYPNPIEAFKERQRQLQITEQEEIQKKSSKKSLVESFKRK